MTFLAQLEEAARIVDKAAGASDRWLFLASILIILAGAYAAIKFLVKSWAEERASLRDELRNERAESRLSRKEDQKEFLLSLAAKDSMFKIYSDSLRANTEELKALSSAVNRRA